MSTPARSCRRRQSSTAPSATSLNSAGEISPDCLFLSARMSSGGRVQLPTVVTGNRVIAPPRAWGAPSLRGRPNLVDPGRERLRALFGLVEQAVGAAGTRDGAHRRVRDLSTQLLERWLAV